MGIASRLAWRELRTAKWTNLLLSLLIAVPIAVVIVAMAVVASFYQTPEEAVADRLGQFEADIRNWDESAIDEQEVRPGDEVVRVDRASLTASGSRFDVAVTTTNFEDPRFGDLWRIRGDGDPSSDVWIDPEFMQAIGVKVGDEVLIDDVRGTVAGTVNAWVPGILVGPEHPLAGGEIQTIYSASARDWAYLEERELTQNTRQEVFELETSNAIRRRQFTAGAAGAITISALIVVGAVIAAAFTLTLRRSHRTLALLRATGASRRTLRRVVLWQGPWIGAAGSAMGVLLGLGVSWATVTWLRHQGIAVGGCKPDWPVIGALALFGPAAGLVAAWFPSRRVLADDTMAALRHGAAASAPARFPKLAAVTLVAGLGLLGYAYTQIVGEYGLMHTINLSSIPTLGAGLLLLAGCLGLAGWWLHGLAGIRRGPLAWRMAARDSDRSRSRAVATIGAVAGATVLGLVPVTFLQMVEAVSLRDHEPSMQPGQVQFATRHSTEDRDIGRRAIERVTGETVEVSTTRDAQAWFVSAGVYHSLIIDDGSFAEFVLGDTRPDVHEALAAGKLVALEGELGEGVIEVEADGQVVTLEHRPEVVAVDNIPGKGVLVGPDTARAWGLAENVTQTVYADVGRPMTEDELAEINALLSATGTGLWVVSETGPSYSVHPWQWISGAGGFVIILAIGSVTMMLALGEGRASRVVLANVGASRQTLRNTAFAQAAVNATLGAAIGAAVVFATFAVFTSGIDAFMLVGWWWPIVVAALPVPLLALIASRLVKPEPARVVRAL